MGKPQWAGPTFKAGDPRATLAVNPPDPRIHFALNCGAASCPAIRVFTPASLDAGLEAAAQAFCSGEAKDRDHLKQQGSLAATGGVHLCRCLQARWATHECTFESTFWPVRPSRLQ